MINFTQILEQFDNTDILASIDLDTDERIILSNILTFIKVTNKLLYQMSLIVRFFCENEYRGFPKRQRLKASILNNLNILMCFVYRGFFEDQAYIHQFI